MPSSPPSAPTALLSTSAAGTIDTENNRREEGGRGERKIVQIEDSESGQSVGTQDGEGGVKGNVNVLTKDVRQDGAGARQEEEEDVIESALREETPRRSSTTKHVQGDNGKGQAADVEGDVEMEKAGQEADGGKEGSASNGGGKRRSSAGKTQSKSPSKQPSSLPPPSASTPAASLVTSTPTANNNARRRSSASQHGKSTFVKPEPPSSSTKIPPASATPSHHPSHQHHRSSTSPSKAPSQLPPSSQLKLIVGEDGTERVDLDDSDEDDEDEEDSEEEEEDGDTDEEVDLVGPESSDVEIVETGDGEGEEEEGAGEGGGRAAGLEGQVKVEPMEGGVEMQVDGAAGGEGSELSSELTPAGSPGVDGAHPSATTPAISKSPTKPSSTAQAAPQPEAGPSTHPAALPAPSDLSATALAPSADPSLATNTTQAVTTLLPKPKQRRKRKTPSPSPPPPLLKPNITLRLDCPVDVEGGKEYSLYERAWEDGVYDSEVMEVFSLRGMRGEMPGQAERAVVAAAEGVEEIPGGGKGKTTETEEERMARELEEKYDSKPTKKRRRKKEEKNEYDASDPFIDDSTAGIDAPEYAGVPVRQGFFVHVGEVELKVESPKAPKPRKPRGSLAQGGDDGGSESESTPSGPSRKKQKSVPTLEGLLPGQVGVLTPMPGVEGMAGGGGTGDVFGGSGGAAAASGVPPTATTAGVGGAGGQVDGEAGKEGVSNGAVQASGSPAPAAGTSAVVAGTSAAAAAPPQPRVWTASPQLLTQLVTLKEAVNAHDWSNKKNFPPHLRALVTETAKIALTTGCYGDEFFNLMPTIFPYNRFTMQKLIKKEVYEFHHNLLVAQRENLIQRFKLETEKITAENIQKHELAMAQWEEAQKHKALNPDPSINLFHPSGDPSAPSPSTFPNPSVSLAISPLNPPPPSFPVPTDPLQPQHIIASFQNPDPTQPFPSPAATAADARPPPKKFPFSDDMKTILYQLMLLVNEIFALGNEKKKLEGQPEAKNSLSLNKALYADLYECFPPDYMTTTNISREASKLKVKWGAIGEK